VNGERLFIWCTYRDWSFHVLEGLLDLPGWRCGLIVTTPTSCGGLAPPEGQPPCCCAELQADKIKAPTATAAHFPRRK